MYSASLIVLVVGTVLCYVALAALFFYVRR